MGNIMDEVKLMTIDSRSSTLNQVIAGVNYRSSSPPGSIWTLLTGITRDKESCSLGLSGQGPPQRSSLPSASPLLPEAAPTMVLSKGVTEAHRH